MKNYKKYIPYLLFAVAIIAIMMIFQPCRQGNTHKNESSEVKKEIEAVHDKEAVANRKVELLNEEIRRKDSIIISLKTKKDITEGQLNDSKNTAFRLAQQLKAAKTTKDTASYILNCDSLADESLMLQGIIISYEEYVDTLSKITDAQLRAKDQVIQNRIELYGQLRTSFDKVSENYQSLYKDYSKEVRQRKKARTMNRLLGVVAIGLGALYLTK